MTSPVHTIASGRSVWHASRYMAEQRIGSLVVVDGGRVIGILTSRDIRAAHPNRIVADAMTPDPECASGEDFAWDALRRMEERGIERLIVVREGEAVGIVTREALTTRLSEWIDPLTKLYRSPFIHAVGEMLLSRGETFQLLFIDLNRFGEINKQHGHPAGDDLIRAFASRLRSLTGEGDFVCRYAGDEFALITRRPEAEMPALIEAISQELAVGPARVSADVGWLNDRLEPSFARTPFRELLSQASLLSTKAKSVPRGV